MTIWGPIMLWLIGICLFIMGYLKVREARRIAKGEKKKKWKYQPRADLSTGWMLGTIYGLKWRENIIRLFKGKK